MQFVSPCWVRSSKWWYNDAGSCRSALRSYCDPGYRFGNLGFRVVLVPVQ